jgi:putative phosphoesterase
MLRIGLISDTHGLLRPEALEALQGCGHIIHGGDIGRPEILQTLSAIAPVSAVRGNNDKGGWAENLPETLRLHFGQVAVCVIHDLRQLDMKPAAAGISVIVSGHSHKPYIEERGGITYINPGSAGPRRFQLPVSVAELRIEETSVAAHIIRLDGAAA